jgi:hypothetical protein
MRYWKTYRKEIIKKYLTEAFQKNILLHVWQQKEKDRAIIQGILFFSDEHRLKIKLSSAKNISIIDENLPLFVLIPDLEFIFKKDKFIFGNDIIELNYPNEVQIQEKRTTERFSYLYQDHKNITFYPEIVDAEEGQKNVSAVLIDISLNGASMVLPKKVSQKLVKGKKIFLENITDQKLPTPFATIVKYISPYQDDIKSELFKVGLGFENTLDSITYKSILNIIEIKKTKMQGIDPNRYCGLDIEEQIKIFYKIEQDNRVLANNIRDNVEYLDKLRYLTVKMKMFFLKSISLDLLATALRLSSKELIFELFSNVSDNIRQEFIDKLSIEKSASGICKAQDEIVKFVREKEASGEFVLDPLTFITYV